MKNEKAFMSWSGGKDSALALYQMQQRNAPVAALVTTVNSATARVSMHGVRTALLQAQAASLGLPLTVIELPAKTGMAAYEAAVRQAHRQLKSTGFTQGAFGDVLLADVKKYREDLLTKDGLKGLFPLWQMDSRDVVNSFLTLGFRAITVCVNSAVLGAEFCGRLLDEQFFRDLPTSVDPCGENGEYHSFVFDGPLFRLPVRFTKGEIVFKEYPAPAKAAADEMAATPAGFYFCDLLA